MYGTQELAIKNKRELELYGCFTSLRFLASLRYALFRHITADKRLRSTLPKLPSATSLVRKALSEIAGGRLEEVSKRNKYKMEE